MAKSKFFHENIPSLKKLKEIFKELKYKELSLWPSMAPHSYYYQHYKSMGNPLFQLFRILKFLFFVEKSSIKGNGKNKIMVSFFIDRKDHHKLWVSALSSFKRKELILLDNFQKGERNFKSINKRFSFKFPNSFKIYKIWRYLNKQNIRSIIKQKIDFLYFVLLTYYQFGKIDYLSEIIKNYKPKAYVAYSSYRNNDETILTQLCNRAKIKTFTMQNYNLSEFSKFNYESITYENFISDYFLVWGEAGKNILIKFIDNKKILVVGNPLYRKINKIKKNKPNFKTCTVFLSHPSYKKSNFEILEIVKNLSKEYPNIKFRFNVHPDNNEEEYASKLKGKNLKFIYNKNADKEEILASSDFLIMYNSTLVLEAMTFQIPILRYKNESMIEIPVPSINFSNLSELKKNFAKLFDSKFFTNHIKNYYNAYNKNFFQPKNISIPKNYKKIINSLL